MSEALENLVTDLERALSEDFGGARFSNPEGWRLESVALRTFRETVPVVTFKAADRTLCFIVTPTDAEQRAFRRSKRHDITYFSEDVADDDQAIIFKRDQPMIERFAAWLIERDAAA